jgi:NAD(P)-dependent dehydrogenase (short-subunit alcohol dehydrogenase family)
MFDVAVESLLPDELISQAAGTAPAVHVVGLAAERMAARAGGSIVNISSGIGQLGMPGVSVYSALKAGIEAATRSWRPNGATAGSG